MVELNKQKEIKLKVFFCKQITELKEGELFIFIFKKEIKNKNKQTKNQKNRVTYINYQSLSSLTKKKCLVKKI